MEPHKLKSWIAELKNMRSNKNYAASIAYLMGRLRLFPKAICEAGFSFEP